MRKFSRPIKISLALTATMVILLCSSAMGATLTWDVTTGANGTITDGTGTWTTANAWNTGSGNTTWNSSPPDTAIIGGGTLGSAGTITVGSVTVAGITFNTPNGGGTYTLQTGTIRPLEPAATFTANANVTFASDLTISIPNNQNDTTITLNGTATGAVINGIISDNNANGKSIFIAKSGAGTWELTGTNTYNGSTSVSAGTLKIGGAGALTATGNRNAGAADITVSGGTLLLASSAANQINDAATVTLSGGTIQLGTSGMSETVGTLSLSATSTIDFATLASGATLKFADSSAAIWGAFDLNVYNWTDGIDHLFFGTVFQAGLPPGGLGKIKFYSDNGFTSAGVASFLPLGEVAPTVPEPSAVLTGLSLLSLACYRERRWLLRCREARRKATA